MSAWLLDQDPGKDFPCTIESKPPELPRKCLALNVRNLEVENVRRINTIKVLDLRGCTSFDDDGMSRLRGMQLEQLVLVRSKLLTDKAMVRHSSPLIGFCFGSCHS